MEARREIGGASGMELKEQVVARRRADGADTYKRGEAEEAVVPKEVWAEVTCGSKLDGSWRSRWKQRGLN